MADNGWSSSVRRIVVVGQDGTEVLYDRKKDGREKKRKNTRELKYLERATRRTAQAGEAVLQSYISRHNRSSRKERDGWIWDLPKNLYRAGRKGEKYFRKLSPI